MTDYTSRMADAEAAKAAWDRFVGPCVEQTRAEYLRKLAEVAIQPMEGRVLAATQSLSHGLKILANVESMMQAAILDGEVAKQAADSAAKLARMSPGARRVASY